MPATDPSRRITGRKRFERSLVDRIGHGLAGQQTAHFDDDGRQQIRAIDTVRAVMLDGTCYQVVERFDASVVMQPNFRQDQRRKFAAATGHVKLSFQARLNRVTIIPSANPKTMTMTPAMRRP